MKCDNKGLINLDEAKKVIDKFLEDKTEIRFQANFPVCEIENYIKSLIGEWIDIDSNNSGSCQDIWLIYNEFAIKICAYHGDIYIYSKENNEE